MAALMYGVVVSSVYGLSARWPVINVSVFKNRCSHFRFLSLKLCTNTDFVESICYAVFSAYAVPYSCSQFLMLNQGAISKKVNSWRCTYDRSVVGYWRGLYDADVAHMT